MTYLFVLSFCVYVGSTVGHGENSVQSKTERDTSIAHLMYLFMKDINDIYDESRALKDKIGALEAQILDIDSKTKDVDSKTKDLESKTEGKFCKHFTPFYFRHMNMNTLWPSAGKENIK